MDIRKMFFVLETLLYNYNQLLDFYEKFTKIIEYLLIHLLVLKLVSHFHHGLKAIVNYFRTLLPLLI